MNWLEALVKRPVAVTVAVIVALLLGSMALARLSIDLLPNLNLPYAAVITSYQGAGPEEIEKAVTRPLEDVLGTVQGVKNILSYSMSGTSIVLLEFEWGQDMDFAALNMREKVDQVERFLPDAAEKPTVVKFDPNMMPVMTLALYGDMDEERLKDLAENTVKGRLERLNGVAAVNITGGLEREIQVLVDPARLQLYGLSISQVVQALQSENNTFSAGKVADAGKDVLVRVNGEFQDLEEIRRISISTPSGPVRLGDIAEVRDYHAERQQYALYNGRPAVGISIQKQTSGNTVQIAHAVKQAVQELQKELPPGVTLTPVVDQSQYIERAIGGVYRDMFLGGLLAMLIIFIFLRHLRATLVIGLTIPISVITTFVLVYFGKMTLNMMTLGGLSLGIGRMVDDAIVVFDNIYRHRQEGRDPFTAAVAGTRQVLTAVVASTLTTVSVFLPIAFVEGMAKQIFGPLALTVAFSLMASLAVSMTVTPTVAARLLAGDLPPEPVEARSFWHGLVNGLWMVRLSGAYSRFLRWALRHRKLTVAAVATVFIASLALVPAVGVEFLPATDEGTVTVTIELPKGTGLETTAAVADEVANIVRQQPEVQSIYQQIGSSGGTHTFMSGETPEAASLNINLVPLEQRRRSAAEVAEAIRVQTSKIAGAKINVTATSSFGGSMSGAPIQVDIHGSDLERLKELAEKGQQLVAAVPGTAGVENSISKGRPQVEIIVDRERAALYRLGAGQIGAAVATAVGGTVATRYRTGGEEYDVRVSLPEGLRHSIADLENLTVLSPLGVQVPIKAVADLKLDTTPSTIYRYNQDRVASITANLNGTRPLAAVLKDVQAQMAQLQLPPGYSVDYTGQTEMMNETFGQLGLALIMAVVLVYLVMAAQFESFFHPFIIMFSIPVSLTGVVAALMFTGRTFNVVAFIGVIMLAGIVLSNAIILVDYINVLRREGMPREEAILAAGRTRLRPILMTALTTVLAMLPLAAGIGEGAEMEAGLATAVVGGLLASTVLTLILVPVLYTIFEDLGRGLKHLFGSPGRRRGVEV
ncbi:efflux RND transporter permease subunit [Neomoorella humiferrea]|uniref:Swarming motility protein SwrC n=1 Tax=Neomoorella humiferrea TaxID=676965 RepID=A0A2T0AKV6_9FIRM|nr:efflux RND transporter permease subunit [Moorella humiferrea]PRR69242.1 Swarming motility protein SwrC [Moorella humiferrea]